MLIAYLAMLRRHILTNERLSQLAAQLWAQHEEALAFLMDNRPEAETAFSSVAASLFGESPAQFSRTELLGHNIVFNELRGNRASFLPASWFEAFGGRGNQGKWKGCQNWWAGFPLIVWFQLWVRNGGSGKIALYAEVGPLTDTHLRKNLIYKIKKTSEEKEMKSIAFQKNADAENALYSKFLKNNILEIDDVSNEDQVLEKANALISSFMPVLDAISGAMSAP